MPETTSAKAVRLAARKHVPLLDAKAVITVRTVRGREMLEAGLLPLVKMRSDEVEPESAEELLSVARGVIIACAVSPRIVEGPGKANEISIDDLTDEDIVLLYREIIDLSDSRFYGTDHTAYNPDMRQELFERQVQSALMIDTICRRYGLNPLEVLKWDNDDLSLVMALIDVGVAEEKKQIEKARQEAKRKAKHGTK